MGQGEVGGVIHTVLCTWWLLSLTVKGPRVIGTGWANSHPGYMNRLRKSYSYLVGGSFLAGLGFWPYLRLLLAYIFLSEP